MPLPSNRWRDFTELKYPSGTDPSALKHRLTIEQAYKPLSVPIFLNTKAVSVSSTAVARQPSEHGTSAWELRGRGNGERERNTDRSKSWGWRSTERRRRGRAVTGSRDIGSVRQKSDAYRRLPAAGRQGRAAGGAPAHPTQIRERLPEQQDGLQNISRR